MTTGLLEKVVEDWWMEPPHFVTIKSDILLLHAEVDGATECNVC